MRADKLDPELEAVQLLTSAGSKPVWGSRSSSHRDLPCATVSAHRVIPHQNALHDTDMLHES